MRRRITLILTLALALSATAALTACGTSKEDKAKAQACSARDDIRKQVTELQNITVGTATPTGMTEVLNAIGKDVKTIKDAQADLSAERKAQFKKAKAQFESALTQITTNFAKEMAASKTLANGQGRLVKVATAVALAYQTAFGSIDCS